MHSSFGSGRNLKGDSGIVLDIHQSIFYYGSHSIFHLWISKNWFSTKMKETLGRYKIVKEIGRGAMGVVYQGYDPKIDRIVALKTIRKDRLAESRDVEDLVTRFQKEVRATGKLVHPNIIIIYDTGEDEETAYIAMEYIEGDTLENLIQKGIRFPMEKIIDIIDQICDGLEYTHRQGIVHRDLKPSNIMLVKGERVKIADFGISKAVGASSSPLTQAGILLGTPSYMSPEQIAGREIDGRSDIFSLGIILYQLLSGEKPFVGDTIPTLLYNIVNKDPSPPSQIDSRIPSNYDEVIAKALEKNPDKRYQTAKHFVEDLKRVYRGEGLMEAPSIETTMTVTEGVSEEIYPKRNRYGLLAGIAVLLLALVLGGYYWMYYRTPVPPEEEGVSEVRVEERVTTPVEKGPVKPVPLPAPVGTIAVSSIPSGASVFLDGKPQETPTPTVIGKVTVGEKYEIRVEKEGFKGWSKTVELKSDKPMTIEAPLIKLLGTIDVSSTPPGAILFLDGKKMAGLTPMELPDVSADDTHNIKVIKKGYATRIQTITLKPDERKEVGVILKPLLGGIRISSAPPGAKVYMNDKYTTLKTPALLSDLSLGKRYKLRLKKEGYGVWEGEVNLKDSKPMDLPKVMLEEAYGELNLLVSPWADVYYEGNKLGTTPLANIRFQEGTHKRVLKNPPLNIEKEVTVKIVADKVTKEIVDITEGIQGTLKIRVNPWAYVYVDGESMGMTPLKPLELTVGEHTVLVKNEKLAEERSFRIIIKPNEVVSKNINLLKKE